MKRNVYLDYAAATPLDPRVRKAMEPYEEKKFGNPASLHTWGRIAKEAVEDARNRVARILNCKPEEIIFTSGGTEAINLAILGSARYGSGEGEAVRSSGKGHIITTKIEHHAVLRTVEQLAREGFAVTYLDVDEYGFIDPEAVRRALRRDTVLVSIMYANNEIGTIEPIAEIARVVNTYRRRNSYSLSTLHHYPLFFTDAAQVPGCLSLDVAKLGVDMMALDASKFYGPKGAGCLYIKKGAEIKPIMYGGGQERGLRSGTLNVPGIVGFAKALEVAERTREKETKRITKLRNYFIDGILRRIERATLNGSRENRLPNNVNISIPGLEGEAAVIYLDKRGVAASTGAACSSVELEPSHVIRALGKSREAALGTLRFTLGRETKKEDLDYALGALEDVVKILLQ